MRNITCAELANLISSGESFQLVDVRESTEHAAYNIGGQLIPLSVITKNIDQLDKKNPVILYCRVGIRSQIAIQRLLDKYPFQNLVNLSGGTEAWKKFSGE